MAVPFTKTDIFKFLESSGAGITQRMTKVINDPSSTIILNEKLQDTLTQFAKTFPLPIAGKAAIAARNGHLVLYMSKEMKDNLPEAVPFFRYTKSGQSKVAVNLTNLVHVTQGADGNDYYGIDDMRKFFAVMVSAFINLTIPDPINYPVKVMEMGAIMWAKVFCRILNSTIGLATSRDRYACFYYYAIRFYLTYFIAAPAKTIDSIAEANVQERQSNGYIQAVEEYLKDPIHLAEFYGSFTGFCNVLFNNEITNTKSLRMSMADPNAKLNVSFYIRKYVDAYYQSAIMGLANAHYFTWIMLCVSMKAYMVNVKMLASVVDVSKLLDKYFAALYTEAENAGSKYL